MSVQPEKKELTNQEKLQIMANNINNSTNVLAALRKEVISASSALIKQQDLHLNYVNVFQQSQINLLNEKLSKYNAAAKTKANAALAAKIAAATADTKALKERESNVKDTTVVPKSPEVKSAE